MRPTLDLTGHRYGMLYVDKKDEQRSSPGKPVWVCNCDCGNTYYATTRQLRAFHRVSCGCARGGAAGKARAAYKVATGNDIRADKTLVHLNGDIHDNSIDNLRLVDKAVFHRADAACRRLPGGCASGEIRDSIISIYELTDKIQDLSR